MKHIIYQTTNLVNNKIYIGYHATENINDSYLGSGLLLKRGIKKYGIENFKKEILFIFPSDTEALLKELEIVNEEFVSREDTYNLKIGGEGGWDHIPRLIKEDKEFRKKMYSKVSQTIKKLYEEGKLSGWSFHKGFEGKIHSKNSKNLISMNNGNKLSQKDIEKRRLDFIKEVGRGSVGRLSRIWKISHTQVRRFLSEYIIGAKITREWHTFSDGKESPLYSEGVITGYTFSGIDKKGDEILIISFENEWGTISQAYVPEDIIKIY